MKARELMTPNPECVTRDDSIARAAQIMRDLDVGLVPVVDNSTSMRLQGVITDRDIAVRHVADGHHEDCRVGDHMSSGNVRTVSPDDDVKDVMEAMKENQVRRIPVVEGEFRLVGIIAQADLATERVGDRKVADTIEKISEPGSPRRR
jgi:CBS domain-containing protein